MSQPVSLADLLNAIGGEDVRFQTLEQSMEGIKTKKGVSIVSFATDALTPTDVAFNSGPKGLIVWVDRDLMRQRLDELKSGKGLTFDKVVAQRDELLAALERIAATKPVMMHDENQQELLCYSPADNPVTLARIAIAKAGAM